MVLDHLLYRSWSECTDSLYKLIFIVIQKKQGYLTVEQKLEDGACRGLKCVTTPIHVLQPYVTVLETGAFMEVSKVK